MTLPAHPNFNRVAPIYDFFKTLLFLGSIQRCQYYHLPHLKGCKNILVIGGGTGRIVGAIQQYCAFDTMVYVDSSEQMIKKAREFIRKKYPGIENLIEFQTSDVNDLLLHKQFDAIIMPFVADCFSSNPLINLGKKLSKVLSPGGILLLSDFYESKSSGLAKALSRIITVPLYFVLDILCGLGINRLPDFDELTNTMNLGKTGEHLFFFGLLKSMVYQRKIEQERD